MVSMTCEANYFIQDVTSSLQVRFQIYEKFENFILVDFGTRFFPKNGFERLVGFFFYLPHFLFTSILFSI